MTQAFTIIFSLIAWFVAMLVMLIFGPLFWILTVARTMLLYAAMILLHAIANKDLKVTTKRLEESIETFPRFLERMGSALTKIMRRQVQHTLADDEAFETLNPGNSWSSALWEMIWWIIKTVVPALIVWVSIYFLFLYLSSATLNVFNGWPIWVVLLLWAGFWCLLGLFALRLPNQVRAIVVVPYIFLVAVAWLPIGLVFWFPAIASGLARFFFSLFRSVFSGRESGEAAKYIESGVAYYLDGWQIAVSVLTNAPAPDSYESDSAEQSFKQDLVDVWRFVAVRVLSLIIYPLFYVCWLAIEYFRNSPAPPTA